MLRWGGGGTRPSKEKELHGVVNLIVGRCIIQENVFHAKNIFFVENKMIV